MKPAGKRKGEAMTKEHAITKLEAFLSTDTAAKFMNGGEIYQDKVLGAEDALNALLGLEAIRTEKSAIEFAETL